MKIKLNDLKKVIADTVSETKIKPSASYMKKEKIREEMQTMIVDRVKSGDIVDQESLKQFIDSMNLAMTTLSVVPFEAWKTISSK
jgi:hypothetical protein